MKNIKTYKEFKEEYNINEVLTKETSIKDVIDDFVNSDDERFAGKSKEERRKMAIGVFYGFRKNESMTISSFDESSWRGRKNDLDESEPNENI